MNDSVLHPARRPRRTLRPLAAAALGTALAVGGLVGTATPASADVQDLQAACNEVVGEFGPYGFTDIRALPSGTRFAIDCLAYHDITYGTSPLDEPPTYSPDQPVTRLQMAKFLSRVSDHMFLGATEVGWPEPAFETGFADVDGVLSEDDVYDISVIQALGVTEGRSPTRYAPREAVTREEMAIFINRMQDWLDGELTVDAAYDPADRSTRFSDVADGSRAADAIYALEGAGIVQGTGGGRFSPKETVTRAQMALFIMRHIDENVAADRLVPLFEAYGNSAYLVDPFEPVDVIDGGEDRVTSEIWGFDAETVTTMLVDADRVERRGKFFVTFPDATTVGADDVASRIVTVNGRPVPAATAAPVDLDDDGIGTVGLDLNGDERVVLVTFFDEDGNGLLDVGADGVPVEEVGVSATMTVTRP